MLGCRSFWPGRVYGQVTFRKGDRRERLVVVYIVALALSGLDTCGQPEYLVDDLEKLLDLVGWVSVVVELDVNQGV